MPLEDCDGDGVPDYGVEAVDMNGPILVDRTLRVVSGASGSVLWSSPLQDGSDPPSAVSIGDVDGDGSNDVAYAHHLGGLSRVRVVNGATGALIHELPNLNAGAANRVEAIRDLDGDGVLDLLVHSGSGSPGNPPIFQLFSGATGVRLNGQFGIQTQDAFMIAAPNPGQVKVVGRALPKSLRRFDLTQVAVLELDVDGPDDLVLEIDPVGDVNGDGWGDLLCRSITDSPGGQMDSRISVLSGESLQTIWDVSFPAGSSGRFVPENVVSLGDQNGDGVEDVGVELWRLVSGISAGRVARILSGADGSLLRDIESLDSFTSWSTELAPVGDLDGDGVSEIGICGAYSKLSSSGVGPTSQVFLMRSSEVPAGMQGLEFCRVGPANSTGEVGRLTAIGSSAVPAGTLTFQLSELPPQAFGILIVSADPVRIPPQTGTGLCLSGSIGRYRGPGQIVQADAAGQAALLVNTSLIPLATTFATPAAGDTFGFQFWHRDTDGSGGVTSRFTSGVTVTYR